jgi:hypothetical protein
VVLATCLSAGWASTASAAKKLKVVTSGGIDSIYCTSNDAEGFFGFAIEQDANGSTTEYASCSDNEVVQYDWSGQYPGGGMDPMTGISRVGALAWDGGRHALWACADGNRVGTYTPAFADSIPFEQRFVSAGCETALAYDAVDDSVFTSDGSGVVQHWTAGGTLLSSTDLTAQLGGSHVRAMTFGGSLFVSTDTGDVYRLTAKLRRPTLLGNVGSEVVDLECDDAGPTDVLFVATQHTAPQGSSLSSFTGYGVKDGTCRTGGGNKPDVRPVVELAPTPDTGPAPLTTALDASGSHDPDGAIGGYYFYHGERLPDWLQLGGQSTPIATWTYTTPGVFHPSVGVFDDLGLWGSTAVGTVVVTTGQPCVPGGRPTATFDPSSESFSSGYYGLFELRVTNPGCEDETVRSVEVKLPPGGVPHDPTWELDQVEWADGLHPDARGLIRVNKPFTSHADGATDRILMDVHVPTAGTYQLTATITLGDGTKVAATPATLVVR